MMTSRSLICLLENQNGGKLQKGTFCETVFGFFYSYYVGITVIARWPASGISSELLLTIKTFDISHKFHRNATITHETQKTVPRLFHN
jgi:hypothetical protein